MNESVYGGLPQFVIILVRFCHPISEIYNNQKRLIICKKKIISSPPVHHPEVKV